MVNNVEEDGTPYFQTANHCGVNAGNAPSVVVYWNYETPMCNGTADDDNDDSDSHNIHNANSQSGATFRASWEPSDMTLIELSSRPDPAWGVTYAGWDATDIESYTGAVAIHQPSVDEKRISFENDATSTSSYWGTGTDTGDKTHIRVSDWDVGTTEGGSSGSPLFDPVTKRVIGQLHGGSARCGVDESDYYGRYFVSWTGGGTDFTRLCTWLDPRGTGKLFVEAYDPQVTMPRIKCIPSIGLIPEGGAVTSTCTISSQYEFTGDVNLSATSPPQGIDAVFSPKVVAVPSDGEVTSTLTIAVTTTVAALTAGSASSPTYDFDAEASYGGGADTAISSMSVIITEGRDDVAMYDSRVGAPHCWAVGPTCASGDLLQGRGTMEGGAEEHAPNTLDGCADGGKGSYGFDESMEGIIVRTVSGEDMVEGTAVEVVATVQPWQQDYADFYYAADATKPDWKYIGTVQPQPPYNVQNVTQTYVLPAGGLQAVRVAYRHKGSNSTCPDGDYDEADDIAFAVPQPTPDEPWITILSNDFEEGLQDFNVGGKDAERLSDPDPKYVHSGNWTLLIRDGRKADSAVVYTNHLPTSDYEFIRVSFWFNPRGISTNEGFALETSACDETWDTVANWTKSVEWKDNHLWYEVGDTTQGANFTAVEFPAMGNCTAIRFRCQGNKQREKVYIDDVLVEANYTMTP